MNLTVAVKQKNEQLLLQSVELQRQLHARLAAPEFSAFFITFGVAPLLAGVVAGAVFAPKSSLSHKLCRAAFPGLRLWPFS